MKEIVEKAKKIVILTHMAPDGDAMGSALAMYHYVMDRFSQSSVHVIVPNAFAAFFNWMPGADAIKVYEKEPDACNALIAEADLLICTDFNDPKRISTAGEKMMANPAPKILIDHHLKGTEDNGQWTKDYSDPSASSACEIVYRLINNDQSPITNPIATCLYTGLMTDTGNFAYSFDQFSIDRMRLTGFALYRKMRIYPEHHLALITLSADELDQFHYQPGDCEGLVNMPLQIGEVFYSVLMREERPKPGTPKPRIRISFRSQGDRPVNIWANEVFHGGGHMNASGGELFGQLAQAVRLFEQTYKKYLK